jgi:hypothetical protein
MNASAEYEIRKYEFTADIFEEFSNNHYANDLWPLVYILSDEDVKFAYIGETTDVHARLGTHLKNDKKQSLTSVHLITSDKFNKSATLDIESNLIKYIAGDGQYKLLNGNLGLANHNYYQKKETYWSMFNSIWNKLRGEGLVKHSIEYINNTDLFKFSPYKSLSKEQQQGLFNILNVLLDDKYANAIVEGGAGTGKTVLAIFLFKLLSTNIEDFNFQEFGDEGDELLKLVKLLREKYPNPKMALVIPMASFRKTLKVVFTNIHGLKASMVIGPAEVTTAQYDILVVDEAHRLRRRVNLGAYFGAFDTACRRLGLVPESSNELDWVMQQSSRAILFYDEAQSIKPSDVRKESFDRIKEQKNTVVQQLKSQFRVRGGNGYVQFIDNLLNCKLGPKDAPYRSKDYEFLLFDSIDNMVAQIKRRNSEDGLARLIAGFSWKWISARDVTAMDIEIDGTKLKWNVVATDWINSEGSVNEVGCIHTTQGYDLNYSGVIFGNEVTYNIESGQIEVRAENYFDINGKQSIKDPSELTAYIINIYRTIMLRAIRGTYVYVCDDALREYFAKHIPNAIESEGQVQVIETGKVIPFQNAIPIYSLQAAAGEFGEFQQIDEVDWIAPPKGYQASADLFACTVIGESMNKVIPNGALCMFQKYKGGSRNGQIVLVEHSDVQDADAGSCYTVKEYQSKKVVDGANWSHESITLKPLTDSDGYVALELSGEETLSFKVVGVFICVLSLNEQRR